MKNKYGNIKQVYNGRQYDSKLEAMVAGKLDMLKKSVNERNRVRSWEPQHKISIDINGVHICNYFIDFKVEFVDGRNEFWEAKGMETDVWKIKWKLTKAIYPDYVLVLIK